jgi:hypothetical protein
VHTIGEVEDIDSANQAKLNDLGIRTTDDLLTRAATPGDRTELAGALGVTDREILKWANCADLMRVDGIGMQFADLLEEAGVDTIPELAQRNAGNLHARVVEVNTERQLSGRAPTAQEVEGWIAQAKALPRILQYSGGGAPSDTASSSTASTSADMSSTASSSSDTSSSDTSSSEAATTAMPTADASSSGTAAADTPSVEAQPADTSSATTSADSTISTGDRAREAASAAADTSRGAASSAADAAGSAARTSTGTAASTVSSGGGFLQRLMSRLRGRS